MLDGSHGTSCLVEVKEKRNAWGIMHYDDIEDEWVMHHKVYDTKEKAENNLGLYFDRIVHLSWEE